MIACVFVQFNVVLTIMSIHFVQYVFVNELII